MLDLDKVANEDLRRKIDDLEETIEKYRALVDNSPDLLYRTDLQGRITFLSPSVYRLSGYTTEEAIGMKMAEDVYLFPEERESFLTKLQEKGRVANFETQLKRKDGSIWWASTNAQFYKDKDGRILGVDGITRDISERKTAEKALQESEERFRKAFHTSPDSINLNRASDGLYIDINQGFTNLLGYTREEVTGKTSLSLNIWKNPEDRQRLIDGLNKQGYVENLEAEFRGKDGKGGIGLMSACLLEINEEKVILSITREISERKKVERQLQQAQKFEAIGTLAGGIAHDFNNILMGIQGRASLISVNLDPLHPHAEHINAIEENIRSATNLTKQLLGFASGGKYEVKPVDLNELVGNSAEMFSRTKKEIRMHSIFQDPPPVAAVDRGQIEQVLLNLYVNAWQAMAEGGEIYLMTRSVTLEEDFCRPHNVKPGQYAKISVTDTGAGMNDAIRQQAFDPFFTTKSKGRGTGLGLASAYGIIKNHAGIITVYSEVGHGSTFNIYLPLSNEKAYQDSRMKGALAKGSETVLLVDDEEGILDVEQALLEELGYTVIVADNGREAIDVIRQRGDEIDLIILDLIMPGMDGGRVFDEIKKIQPQTKVVLSSGYSIDGQADRVMKKGCDGFIQKPFNILELSQKVRGVLDTL